MMLFKMLTVAIMLALPSLIRMVYKSVKTVEPCERFIQHIIYLFHIFFGEMLYDIISPLNISNIGEKLSLTEPIFI